MLTRKSHLARIATSGGAMRVAKLSFVILFTSPHFCLGNRYLARFAEPAEMAPTPRAHRIDANSSGGVPTYSCPPRQHPRLDFQFNKPEILLPNASVTCFNRDLEMERPMKAPRAAAHADGPPNTARRNASAAAPTRRDFVRRLTAGLCLPFGIVEDALSEAAPGQQTLLAQAATAKQSSTTARTESDVGSLWPFIQSQAVAGEFPLSWLRPEFKSLSGWKRKARGKLLELLHYSPAKRDPRAEVVERIDAGA